MIQMRTLLGGILLIIATIFGYNWGYVDATRDMINDGYTKGCVGR